MSRAVGAGRKKSKKVAAIIWICVAAAVALTGLFVVMPAVERSIYKLEYQDLIEKYAKQYGVDPYLVAAVIHTESGFDTDAVSGAGAMGLMQIMPETGEWIAGKLGNDGFTANDLLDPETSIQMGCWYLQFLGERFDNVSAVAAAYNAGHNKVTEWLSDSRYSSDGKTLTTIPYAETDSYVKKVTKSYEKYKEFYTLG